MVLAPNKGELGLRINKEENSDDYTYISNITSVHWSKFIYAVIPNVLVNPDILLLYSEIEHDTIASGERHRFLN